MAVDEHTAPAGPVARLCRPEDTTTMARLLGLPVVATGRHTHAPQCPWCGGEGTSDTCPRSRHLTGHTAGG